MTTSISSPEKPVTKTFEPKLMKHREPKDKFLLKIANTATLLIEKDLFEKLMYFIQSAQPTECMWYSLFDRITSIDHPSGILMYRITDLFIPKQRVGAKEVETQDGRSMMELWKEIRTDRHLSAAEISAIMKRARLWGHSHVKMSPVPSGDDDIEWQKMKKSCQSDDTLNPVGMIILNVDEDYTNRIYDPELGLEFLNVNLYIRDPIDYSYIDEALKIKIEKKPEPVKPPTPTYQAPVSTNTQHSTYYTGPTTKVEDSKNVTVNYERSVTTLEPSTGGSNPPHQAGSSAASTGTIVTKTTGGSGSKGSDEDSFHVRTLLPVSILLDEGINNCLLSLENLVEKIIPKNKEVIPEVLVELDNLNRCTNKQIVLIKKYIDNLLSLLTFAGESPSMAIHQVSLALVLLETAIKSIDLTTIKATDAMLANTKDFKGSKSIIQEFFEKEVIVCEELFLFAYAIARLEKTPITDTEQKALFVQKYCDNLAYIVKRVYDIYNSGGM